MRLIRPPTFSILIALFCLASLSASARPLCSEPQSWNAVLQKLAQQESWKEKDLLILKMDLRTDGKSQDILITSKESCGTSGCNYLIYGKDGEKGFCRLGEVSGLVEPAQKSHFGRHDLSVTVYFPTEERTVEATTYRFNGSEYVESE